MVHRWKIPRETETDNSVDLEQENLKFISSRGDTVKYGIDICPVCRIKEIKGG